MKKIFFVYYGTAGSAGLYMDTIYKSLCDKNNVKMFVNYYYPFSMPEARKIFFKYTENCSENKHKLKGKFRKVVRVLELFWGYIKTLWCIFKEKPEVVNYSLINLPFTQYFIYGVRLISPKTKIVITCHDVVPYSSTSHINYRLIYKLSDFLLVHNNESKNILKSVYKIDENKILEHPFPIMNLKNMISCEKKTINQIRKFLFIGVIREEKGVDILIRAWEDLKEKDDIQLTIAGFLPDNVKIDFDKIRKYKNVKLVLKKLSDYEYTNLINDNDCVILPYKQVGNSGVLSTISVMNKVVIASDLPVFNESPIIDKKLIFKNNDEDDLLSIINYSISLKKEEIETILSDLEKENLKIEKVFNEKVIKVYEKI